MESTTTTDSGDDHLVQPLRVGQINAQDGATEWQRFISFRPASQVETLQRRQWGAFGAKMVEGLRQSLQSCQNYQKTVSTVMDCMMLVSQMQTTVTLESNIRTEWVTEAPLDRGILDQLELDNVIAIDRQVAMACRFFGIATPPPESNTVTLSWLRQHIDDNMDRLLECLKQVDPIWASKLNECAKDVQTARLIEQLLIEVGDAHRGACQANDCWKKAYDKYFQTLDGLEKTIVWVYNADQAAAERRRPPPKQDKNRSPTANVEEELQTQLRWLYMAALDFARERRRFVELCSMYLDTVNEVRQQRYDPENVVVKYQKRPSLNTGLPELASKLFSAYWDEQLERFTQLRIVSDEAKRLADTWRRENKKYAALAAECEELSRLPEAKLKALENLGTLLDSNRQAGRELITCLESIVPTLKLITARLQQKGADLEKAKAEALKKGAAAAFDPALDDPVLVEIERKERRLEECMLRCQDAKLGRAECLQNLQHHFCHRENERDNLKRNCDDLEAELNHVNDEAANATRENDLLKDRVHAPKAAKSGDAGDTEILGQIESAKIEVAVKKRKLDNLRLRASNLALRIQCVSNQKKILEAACAEKTKTIREFEKHARDTKKAIADRRRDDPADVAHTPGGGGGLPLGQHKEDRLKKRIREYAEVLKSLLAESDAALRKHSDLSTSNLHKMEEHRNWCLKNITKEIELEWNKIQLRKIACEKGISGEEPTITMVTEDNYRYSNYRKQPQSPVILYHELSTPARDRMQQGRMPLTSSHYATHTVQGDRKTFSIKESISYSHSLSINQSGSEQVVFKTEFGEHGQPMRGSPSSAANQPGPSGVNKNVTSTNDTSTIMTVKSVTPKADADLKTPSGSPRVDSRNK